MRDRSFHIRTMTQQEVELVIKWAAQEGWNPGLHDAEAYYRAGPKGFLIGLLDDKPIAAISAISYGKSFGFLGFYIVRPEYRGQGYGWQTWQAGMHRLKGRNIGLDGVVDQQENYKKSGFKLAYRNIRFEGKSEGKLLTGPDMKKLTNFPFETIQAYDRQFFPEARPEFLKYWINQSGCFAFGIGKNNLLEAYGVLRKCENGFKIGPLYANTFELAESLFGALVSHVNAGESYFLDVPECNLAAMALAEKYGLQVVFETARMYTGKHPELPMEKIYGVTSFEIG
jgi:ribosomal protein S18 acetylase RimI-like enzyme